MTRRNFLKITALTALSLFVLKSRTWANVNTTKSIKYVLETANGYDVVLSDGSKLSVNETGLYVLGRLKEGAKIDEIANELSKLSNKDVNAIKDDLEVFVNNLKVLNII